MGCFASKGTRPVALSLAPLTVFPIGEYPRRALLSIWNNGKVEKLSLLLSEPDSCVSEVVEVAGRNLQISCNYQSACVLPGLDPMGEEKLCQDIAFSEMRGGLFLACIMDGHGPWGHRVVQYCQQICENALNLRAAEAKSNPRGFLQTLCRDCHSQVTGASSGVSCNLSGCTVVFALLVDGNMHLASVGDSRAVLGTTRLPDSPYVHAREDGRPLLERISHMRAAACPATDVRAVPLTRDQKPDDPDEAGRIAASGGVVERSRDDAGEEIGPFRVWKPACGYPGIAMARSIGDMIAHGLGLTAEPELTTVNFRAEDRFVVLASDGVWDVMSSQQACDFLETHRRQAKSQSAPVAQLLCEEARMRWLSVAEAEDVVIDDISCVVVELDPKTLAESKRPQPIATRERARGKTPESPPTPDTGVFLRRDERQASLAGHYVQ